MRPVKRGSSSNSLLARCTQALTLSSVSVSDFEAVQQPLLEINNTACTSQIDGKIFEVMRVRNRFVKEEGTAHSSGGFRDLAFKVKVGFKVLAVIHCSVSAVLKILLSFQRCAPGVFDWSTAVCASVRPAACIRLYKLMAAFDCRASYSVGATETTGVIPPSRRSSASCRFTTK